MDRDADLLSVGAVNVAVRSWPSPVSDRADRAGFVRPVAGTVMLCVAQVRSRPPTPRGSNEPRQGAEAAIGFRAGFTR
jgi:hypothetical protein